MNAKQAIFPQRTIDIRKDKGNVQHLHNLNGAPIYFFLMSDC